MASRLDITPELIASIKTMAKSGMNQEEISRSLGRDCDTLFYNSKKTNPELVSEYFKGKQEHKLQLLKEIEEIGQSSKSDDTRLKSKKYLLNVLHKITETTKQELDATVQGNIVVNINTGSNDAIQKEKRN